MSHATFTQGNLVDSLLLVVGSQIANLTFGHSFGHNLCFRCPNGSYELILDIYVLINFQWYIYIFNPLGFDPCNHSLNIRESTRTPIPKVGVPLGVWGSIPSHSLALSGACGMTPRLPSWPTTLQPLALVVSLRLRLRQLIKGEMTLKPILLLCDPIVIINALVSYVTGLEERFWPSIILTATNVTFSTNAKSCCHTNSLLMKHVDAPK